MTPQELVSAFNASRAERHEEPLLLQKVDTDRYRMVPSSEAVNARAKKAKTRKEVKR